MNEYRATASHGVLVSNSDMANNSTRRVLPVQEGVFADLEADLWNVFQVKFQIWQPDSRPHRLIWPSPTAKETAPLEHEENTVSLITPIDPDVFARLAGWGSEPESLKASDDQWWVVIPIAPAGSTEAIAAGLIHTADPALLLRLAHQFQKQQTLKGEVARHEDERDSLIRQITADFEELEFLRRMAESLALAKSNAEPIEMAGSILPKLRQRIHAEAVVFVSAGRDKSACLVGRPVLSSGRNSIDDKSCTQLVERFRDAATVQPVVRNHCARSDEFNGIEGLRSFILAPMLRSKAVLGWLLAINRVHTLTDGPKKSGWRLSRNEFGTNEASLLRSTASVLATHATNVELLRDKDQLLFEMVRALVNVIEAKDRYTCGHSERVALYAKHLGSAMGLKAKVCNRIYLAGLLHDIGKIAVRDAVLSNENKLSDDEFAEIKRHPDGGWSILFGLDALDDVLAGVLHHHERWDGRGYPDGLIGENIPHDARILAVSDAFDAMTSDRPYRQSLAVERAEAILREGAGSQWDPTVIGTFLRIMPEINQIRNTYEPRQPASRQGCRLLQGLDPGPQSEPLSTA